MNVCHKLSESRCIRATFCNAFLWPLTNEMGNSTQVYMGRLQLGLLAQLTFGANDQAQADYEADFVRVTCVPQSRYFEIEYKPLHSNVVDGGDHFDSNVWAKQGYLSPSKLRYECQLPDSKYVVTSTKPESGGNGMCGADPEIRLNLARNGRLLVKDVVFGGACMGRAPC